MLRQLLALIAVVSLAGCGGGGGGGSGTAATAAPAAAAPAALTNFVTVSVDQGPAALNVGPNAYTQSNVAYVSVTLCAPGSNTNCQTIDHVQVDTGSIGLRIFGSVLAPTLLAALPNQTDTSSNAVGECYQYIDGYVFGSVRAADFAIGGEKVSGMPLQILSDGGQFANVPSACSAGGGSNIGTVQNFGSNGIIGIGTTTTDCGSICQNGGQSAAIYFDCPTTGCASIIARNASTSAPFQQLPNPVAAMNLDNNGSILALPATTSAGANSLTGTLYFGIGTQTNNMLGTATVYTTTTSSSRSGSGLITVNYANQNLPYSFIDSGSSLYFFEDSTIPLCADADFKGLYCPPTDLTLSPIIHGLNGSSYTDSFVLYNAERELNAHPSFAAIPGVGANPSIIFPNAALSGTFDLGLPFFFGRSVYTAIEGRTAGGVAGPFFAF